MLGERSVPKSFGFNCGPTDTPERAFLKASGYGERSMEQAKLK
jgi:hypothetical protein